MADQEARTAAPRVNAYGRLIGTRRAWRRAALALDDFRELVGPERFDDRPASTPQERELRRPFVAARRALDEYERETARVRGRCLSD